MKKFALVLVGSVLGLGLASPASAQDHGSGYGHRGQHERLEDRHGRTHDRLEYRHDRAHSYGVTRREHRRVHRSVRQQHHRAEHRIERRHDRDHRDSHNRRGW